MTVLSILHWTLFLGWATVCFLRMRTVDGTKHRFVITTLLIVLTVLNIVVTPVRAAVYVTQGDYIGAILTTPNIAIFIWLLKNIVHDDNWFNDHWKKLKNGIKNFQARLQSAFMPAPAPG